MDYIFLIKILAHLYCKNLFL